MEESVLLRQFLAHGNGYYPQDKERFLQWALEAHRNGSEFPRKEMEKHLSPTAVNYYATAFEFVGLTVDALGIVF